MELIFERMFRLREKSGVLLLVLSSVQLCVLLLAVLACVDLGFYHLGHPLFTWVSTTWDSLCLSGFSTILVPSSPWLLLPVLACVHLGFYSSVSLCWPFTAYSDILIL